ALVLALAKRPDLLLLDEPLASLDPLARRELLSTLMEAVAEGRLTGLMSSHIIGDPERGCDYLGIFMAAPGPIAGELQEIAQTHKRLIGLRQDVAPVARMHTIIDAHHTERQPPCWCARMARSSTHPGSCRSPLGGYRAGVSGAAACAAPASSVSGA